MLGIMTWNILSDWCGDEGKRGCCEGKVGNLKRILGEEEGEIAGDWAHRLGLIVEEVRKHDRHVIAFQEVSQAQFRDLNIELGKLGFTGIHASLPLTGYTDIRQVTNGTETAVFWRSPLMPVSTMVEQVDTKEMRNAIAVGFNCPGRHHVVLVSTHPSFKNNDADGEMSLVVERVLALAMKTRRAAGWTDEEAPIVLCGDFNKTPKATFFKRLTGIEGTPLLRGDGEVFREVYTDNAERAFLQQNFGTFVDSRTLDYIFHSAMLEPVRLLQVDRHAVFRGRNVIPHGDFPSDHVPLMCDFKWVEAALPAFTWAEGIEVRYMAKNFPRNPEVLQVINDGIQEHKIARDIGTNLNQSGYGKFFIQRTNGDAAEQHGGCWGAEHRSAFFTYQGQSYLFLNFFA